MQKQSKHFAKSDQKYKSKTNFVYYFRRNTSGNSRTTPTIQNSQSFVKMEMPEFDSNQQYVVYAD